MAPGVSLPSGAKAGPAFGKRGLERRRREIVLAYLLLAPAVLLVLGVLAYPMGWQGWVSLANSVVQDTSTKFIGLRNYAELLGDPTFWRATVNTLGYLGVTAVLKMA